MDIPLCAFRCSLKVLSVLNSAFSHFEKISSPRGRVAIVCINEASQSLAEGFGISLFLSSSTCEWTDSLCSKKDDKVTVADARRCNAVTLMHIHIHIIYERLTNGTPLVPALI
jgi:hypothetical protein